MSKRFRWSRPWKSMSGCAKDGFEVVRSYCLELARAKRLQSSHDRRIVVRIVLIEYPLELNMTELQATKTGPSSGANAAVGRLFRTERQPHSLDESRRLRPQDHCHRLPSPPRHRRG